MIPGKFNHFTPETETLKSMERKSPPFKRLIIAAYRLPFKFSKTKKGYKAVQNDGGLVSAVLSLSENFKKENSGGSEQKIIWAGVAENLPESLDVAHLQNDDFSILPIKIPGSVRKLYYEGFSNDLIWPLFHYFSTYCVFKEEAFEAYRTANTRFCEEIISILKPGDFLWIHDYQLFMLPELIRQKRPDVSIGFFLHIPFPSFEIFRLLPKPWREMVIQGMLGADMIGFHTHDYVQHFLKCVRRTTGYECRENVIYTPAKPVKADAFPIGIDYDKFHIASSNPKVQLIKEKLRKTLTGQKLIFSVDRLDYSKGLLLRLQGFETFLERYPEWHGKVLFNMVVVPSRDSIDKYKKMKKDIESTVGRINGKYGSLAWLPIVYQYKSLSFHELIALYDHSNVGLITPYRDGMNLVAKEYIASQHDSYGVLILSEMAGAAAELNEAIIINPADPNETAEAIYSALVMEEEERRYKIERMQKRISEYNVFVWALDFFKQTAEIKKEQSGMKVRFIGKNMLERIHKEYKTSFRRILFIDYDGTLVAFSRYPEQAVILPETREIIKQLSDDPSNHVVIISGRDRPFLEKQFAGLSVTLVAEHGFFLRPMGGVWQSTVTVEEGWKDQARAILAEYVNRCNGTFIEEKTGSLAWHYRNADSDFAQLRLNELKDDLSEIIRNRTQFEILEGHKVLEIKSGKYDKGQAAASLMEGIAYDFILAAGDDKTDEFLFRAMPDSAYTIRVGVSPTVARMNVSDQPSLLALLKELLQ